MSATRSASNHEIHDCIVQGEALQFLLDNSDSSASQCQSIHSLIDPRATDAGARYKLITRNVKPNDVLFLIDGTKIRRAVVVAPNLQKLRPAEYRAWLNISLNFPC